MLKIATWNVNSVKARLPHLLAWLQEAAPDVLLLQELKCQEDAFPRLEVEQAGYRAEVVGQKSYNGVALLSRLPFTVTARALPGDPEDTQARYVEADVTAPGGCVVRVGGLYLPNGNPVDTDKFTYKVAWMDRLRAHAHDLLALRRPVVLGGDYNICPTDADLYDPVGFANDALCRPESRQRFRALLHDGFTEAFRARHPRAVHRYSFWDYQAGAWAKDHGLRIDHLLLSPQAADALEDVVIDSGPRAKEKASDHTPVWCALNL